MKKDKVIGELPKKYLSFELSQKLKLAHKDYIGFLQEIWGNVKYYYDNTGVLKKTNWFTSIKDGMTAVVTYKQVIRHLKRNKIKIKIHPELDEYLLFYYSVNNKVEEKTLFPSKFECRKAAVTFVINNMYEKK